jgi:hypothetical protein
LVAPAVTGRGLMTADLETAFGPFRLDPRNARLTLGRLVMPLKPKAFDVMAHLECCL